jgi:hypothetical protein
MKQKLLALAATLTALGAGAVVFLNWNDGTVERVIVANGSWEAVDRDSCTAGACTTQQCTAASNHLADAGSPCVPRFVDCDYRISQRMRDLASGAGVVLGPQKYQRLRLIALRCPGADGGLTFGVPLDDAGWPFYAAAVTPPMCVRAPLDGGLGCTRRLADGGTRFHGTGNVMPVDAGVGAQCEAVGCTVFYGDDPDVDL